MSDPNPYEPPREPEPLTSGQLAKRSVGAAAIILLTPPAVVVAAAMGCGISVASRPPSLIMIPIISAVVPFGVLLGLMVWAASVDCQERGHFNQRSRRAMILLATVPLFGLAQILGLVLAVAAIEPLGKASGGVAAICFLMCSAISGLTPFVTLLVMLWLAWRSG